MGSNIWIISLNFEDIYLLVQQQQQFLFLHPQSFYKVPPPANISIAVGVFEKLLILLFVVLFFFKGSIITSSL